MAKILEAKPVVVTRNRRDPIQFPVVTGPGEFVWLSKHDLQVDPTYQREFNERAVERIAANWNWVACGTLTVSLRETALTGMTIAVIDGWHRRQAAMKVPTVTELPCMAFDLTGIKAEATGFLASNVDRKLLSRIDAHRAELLIGVKRAVIIDELAKQAGRSISNTTDNTHIQCVSTIERCVAADEAALRRVWPVIVDVCKGHNFASLVVHGLWAAERRMPNGTSLTDARWHKRVLHVGFTNIERSIKNAITMSLTRNEQVVAMGVRMAVNKGMRGVHLELRKLGNDA